MTKPKEINFSEARQNLRAIVDEVEKTGRPVKILRRGRPVAVVIGDVEYRRKFENTKEWRLAGSLKVPKGLDLDKALKELSERSIADHRSSLERSVKEFLKD